MALWLIYIASAAFAGLRRLSQCPNCAARGQRLIHKCIDCQHRGCHTAAGQGCWPGRQCPRCGSYHWRKIGYVR
jgi:hypothetical protein